MRRKKSINEFNRRIMETVNRGERYVLHPSSRMKKMDIVFEHINHSQFLVVKKIVEKKKS